MGSGLLLNGRVILYAHRINAKEFAAASCGLLQGPFLEDVTYIRDQTLFREFIAPQ